MSSAPILKSPLEIEQMRPACVLTAQALRAVGEAVRPGVTTRELDRIAEDYIRSRGGIPLFYNYPSHQYGVKPFPATICASVNDEVVHGIPSDRVLQEGDIISVDVGARLGEFCGDCASTFAVGEVSRKAEKLLQVTQQSLMKGIAAIHPGGWLKDISAAIQSEAESAGFSVVRQFVGHGIGRDMHEPPQVPNYVGGLKDAVSGVRGLEKLRLEPGLVLAIEPMVNMGRGGVFVDPRDGWVVRTKDRGLSAHFEHTVAVTDKGPAILTMP